VAILQLVPAGDLRLENGDFVTISGGDLVRQKLATRFKFFLNEWFLDQREGVPYYRDVFVKNPDLDVIRSVFRQVIRSTPGVRAIRKFVLRFDQSARRLSFEFSVVAADGEVITVTPNDRLFIIQV
jgi:hypothetical protein